MGKHGESAQLPNGLLPNGLLPGEAESVIRKLDLERWSKAEDRIAELIACIQPNPPSEERRNAVATYVRGLITKCFPCEPSLFRVFTFGSVPLKTYLPDGDIDLSIFSNSQDLKDTWAHQVRDMLESEEKNEDAKFHFRVKEVQYIQAEVKIIKCLVGNIVVDISFNQLGGLCTLCFLEEVDNLINQSHLFKRSIILIKAWCYYESRILGAHHGLISTYALETLVLYIFHVFNNNFAGPLEVLYRFLEFFSKFDWDNFCVSLRGPVHISSLPGVTADLTRKDGGDLLLSKGFLDACNYVYSVYPIGHENHGQPFISKHFNVVDPLRVNNNLGRSVSRGNFFIIRSAFAAGAKKLARLLDDDFPKEDILFEINEFFLNTWERHGSGHRPDARRDDLRWLRSSNAESLQRSENLRSNSTGKKSESISVHESHSESTHGPRGVSSQHLNHISESASRRSDTLTISRTPSQKNHVNVDHLRVADNNRRETNLKQATSIDKDQRSSRADGLVNDIQGRFLFARTHSSPELTDAYSEGSSQGRFNRGPDGGKNQTTSARLDNSRRKILETDNNDTGQNFDSSEGLDQLEALNTSVSVGPSVPVEPSEHKSDILDSDFASHWQNLQFGRLCQNSHHPTPMLYPSPNVLSPICLPGHFPWDGVGRPLSANTNAFSYGPHLVPVSPAQPISNGPASIYHVDEMPIYRSGGTGTYLPSPKVSARGRHSSNTRRGNYSYDRADHHADREGNWNVASKSKPSRNHNRNQSEKSNSRPDRVAAGDGQSERPWGSYRHGSFSSYHSQNSPIRTTTTQGGPANVAYGMYPLPAMNPSIVSSNGPTLPHVMMFYPYGHNCAYASSSEQLEFGSIGTVGFSGMNDASQLNEGSHSSSIMEEQRFHGTPASQSPPDQPSSPHLRR